MFKGNGWAHVGKTRRKQEKITKRENKTIEITAWKKAHLERARVNRRIVVVPRKRKGGLKKRRIRRRGDWEGG